MVHDLELALHFGNFVLALDEIFAVEVAVGADCLVQLLLLLELTLALGHFLLELAKLHLLELDLLQGLHVFGIRLARFHPVLFAVLLELIDELALFARLLLVAVDLVLEVLRRALVDLDLVRDRLGLLLLPPEGLFIQLVLALVRIDFFLFAFLFAAGLQQLLVQLVDLVVEVLNDGFVVLDVLAQHLGGLFLLVKSALGELDLVAQLVDLDLPPLRFVLQPVVLGRQLTGVNDLRVQLVRELVGFLIQGVVLTQVLFHGRLGVLKAALVALALLRQVLELRLELVARGLLLLEASLEIAHLLVKSLLAAVLPVLLGDLGVERLLEALVALFTLAVLLRELLERALQLLDVSRHVVDGHGLLLRLALKLVALRNHLVHRVLLAHREASALLHQAGQIANLLL
mmetsp:Transcript_11460/g.36717  ORF Transcript_11460/g.36717 Transcript_11460/m.36717 type:complete len:402 (-) Transcript_11460:471-1676(-)